MTISITLEKGNHNDRGKPLDLRQKNKVKNMTSLQREYLVGKSTSKTQILTTPDFRQSNDVENNVVTTLRLKDNQNPMLSQRRSPAGGRKRSVKNKERFAYIFNSSKQRSSKFQIDWFHSGIQSQ